MSPRVWYFSQKCPSSGSSSTHGGHQVAQKWTIKSSPFSFERSVLWPARSKMGSSGAAERNWRDPDGESGGTSEWIQTAPTEANTTANVRVRTERVLMD